MTVLLMERVPPGLRGEVARWLVEVGTGVFVGRANALVRDQLWDACTEKCRGGMVRMIWKTNTAQGFDVRTTGAKGRYAEEMDGVWLVRVP
ncbi:MAG: type I-E CRISPR-associated endoribonuclease Cas2e [Bacteroidota bacterium]